MNYFFTQSLEQNHPITIIYIAKDRSITQRKIIVKKVTKSTLIAYCLLRRQIRTFSIDHILSAGIQSSSKAV
ncbi:hypothetical protein [Bacillus sp. J37]|uniref:WYL domain-containing protein n=1 Tax=Bacillus sp. J37 TaxID=935837 RepID=UPI000479DA4A|nr:hypothetical protein [Bacillus sp. J37]